MPQVPQLLGSVATFAHTAAAPKPHITFPVGQEQTPLVQVSPLVQAIVQEPQWNGSVSRLVQVPLQLVWPPVHAPPPVHCPLLQLWPLLQTWPQAPQLLISVLASVHAASAPLPHTMLPVGQEQLPAPSQLAPPPQEVPAAA